MALNNNQASAWSIGQGVLITGSRANIPLNAAYNHLVSGPAMGYRFRAQAAGPLQEFYAFLDATTGNRANVSMRCRLYQDNNSASSFRPSSNLIATATNTALPASDDRWIRWEFPTPPPLTFDENYWIIIDNLAAAPATDFPGILTGLNFRTANRSVQLEPLQTGYSTTNGYSSNGVGVLFSGIYVVDGLAFGQPFTSSANAYTSNQLRHGALFAKGIESFLYYSFLADGTGSTTNILEVQNAANTPGSGVMFTANIPTANADLTLGTLFNPRLDLSGADEYIVSLRATANVTTPSSLRIEGYADYPAVFDQFFDGVVNCKAIEEVAGQWQVIPGAMARINLLIDSIKPSSSSGIPLGRIISGGV